MEAGGQEEEEEEGLVVEVVEGSTASSGEEEEEEEEGEDVVEDAEEEDGSWESDGEGEDGSGGEVDGEVGDGSRVDEEASARGDRGAGGRCCHKCNIMVPRAAKRCSHCGAFVGTMAAQGRGSRHDRAHRGTKEEAVGKGSDEDDDGDGDGDAEEEEEEEEEEESEEGVVDSDDAMAGGGRGMLTRGRGRASARHGRGGASVEDGEGEEAGDADGDGSQDSELAVVHMAEGAASTTHSRLIGKTGRTSHIATHAERHTYTHAITRAKPLPSGAPPVYAPLSLLHAFNLPQIDAHVRALRAETFQRRFRPLLLRLMEHPANQGIFNSPVQPLELGIPDYFNVIKHPMDLGTVRQKLEAGRYSPGDVFDLSTATIEFERDVNLVFNNATSFNPKGHFVHTAAAKLKEEFDREFAKVAARHDSESKRKDAHACGFCQGQMCRLCGDKCLRFDPPSFSCDCCFERVKRGDTYYRSPSGQRWCSRCVSNGGMNAEPGAVLPPVAVLRALQSPAVTGSNSAAHIPHLVNMVLAAAGIDLASIAAAAAAIGITISGLPAPPPPTAAPRMMLRVRRGAGDGGDGGSLGCGAGGGAAKPLPATAPAPAPSPAWKGAAGHHRAETDPTHALARAAAAGQSINALLSGRSGEALRAKWEEMGFNPATLTLAQTLAANATLVASTSRGLKPPTTASTSRGHKAGPPSSHHHHGHGHAPSIHRSRHGDASGGTATAGPSPAMSLAQSLRSPIAILSAALRRRLEKRVNDDIVAEPWVQCDRCNGWVHQICAMFNARKNALLPFDASYVCPLCRRDELVAETKVASPTTSATRTNGRGGGVSAGPATTDRAVGSSSPLASGAGGAGALVTAASSMGVSAADIMFHREGSPGGTWRDLRSGRGGGVPPASPPLWRSSGYGGQAPSGPRQVILSASADPFATAASLPTTPLSEELEGRVRARMCEVAGPEYGASLVVRMVSSLKKTITVPEQVRALFTAAPPHPGEMVTQLASPDTVLATAMESVAGANSGPTPPAGGEPPPAAAPAPGSPNPPPISARPVASPASAATSTTTSRAAGGANAPTSPASAAPTTSGRGGVPGVATQYAPSYTYRQRVVLLFQRLDGVDVCLFALYVQEYGPDCPPPNTNTVYIAYLDSVRYLRPLISRTAVYHELLAAYLANARARGFQRAFIWACPPQRGDGYIFHVHPPSQRVPGKERLREWYDEMLRQLGEDGVVAGVTSLFDEFFEVSQTTTPPLPPVLARAVADAQASLGGSNVLIETTMSSSGGGGPAGMLPALTGMKRRNPEAEVTFSDSVVVNTVNTAHPANKRARMGDGAVVATAADAGPSRRTRGNSTTSGGGPSSVLSAGATSTASTLTIPLPLPPSSSASAPRHSPTSSTSGATGRSVSSADGLTGGSYTLAGLPPATALVKAHASGSGSVTPSAVGTTEVIRLRTDAGLPPFFAGDFWAMEMERWVRDAHKRLLHRASGGTSREHRVRAGSIATVQSEVPEVLGKRRPVGGSGHGDDNGGGTGANGNGSVLRTLLRGVTSVFAAGGGMGHDNEDAPPAARRASTRAGGHAGGVDGGGEVVKSEDAPLSPTSLLQRGIAAITSLMSPPGGAGGPSSSSGSHRRREGGVDAAVQGGGGHAVPAWAGGPPPFPWHTLPDTPQARALPAVMALLPSQTSIPGHLNLYTPQHAFTVTAQPVAAVAGGGGGGGGGGSEGGGVKTMSVVPSWWIPPHRLLAVSPPPSVHSYLTTFPIVYGPQATSLRIGPEYTVHPHPLVSLASRLREMRREFIVVHLAPLQSSHRHHHHHHGGGGGAGGTTTPATARSTASSTRASSRPPMPPPTGPVGRSTSNASGLTATTNGGVSVSLSAYEEGGRPSRSHSRHSRGGEGEDEGGTTDTHSSGDGHTADMLAAAKKTVERTDAADAESDERISCDFFDTRHGFLRMCQGNNYQFDTLRRAKHSSMMILWHLHNPSIPAYAHTCNACEADIGCGTRWHCETCYDFDVCDSCKEGNNAHPHPLTPIQDMDVVVQVEDGTRAPTASRSGGGGGGATSHRGGEVGATGRHAPPAAHVAWPGWTMASGIMTPNALSTLPMG